MFSVVVSSKLHGTTPSLHGCIVLSVDPSSNKTGTEEKFVTGIDWMLSKRIACPTDSGMNKGMAVGSAQSVVETGITAKAGIMHMELDYWSCDSSSGSSPDVTNI
ncbi:hypothetical protein OUZ56_003415 [Daphnia magna]|uniref:Uncharacterized protein n=1 Tax=Daphnia magna TaxID=35525 RepID=A0ABR0A8N0_9CRUS|nr:hypothetical protein OUZ56_003415 [Daphnia magna]